MILGAFLPDSELLFKIGQHYIICLSKVLDKSVSLQLITSTLNHIFLISHGSQVLWKKPRYNF